MSANLTALAYLVASVLFILALRGLSSPTAARRGNMMGIAGMAIAVIATVVNPQIVSYEWIIAAIVVGGAIGTFIARKIEMSAMPQLVAGFHSLVGLAAVFVAAAAFTVPPGNFLGPFRQPDERIGQATSCHRSAHPGGPVRQPLGDAKSRADLR